jgi:hypothetical protein
MSRPNRTWFETRKVPKVTLSFTRWCQSQKRPSYLEHALFPRIVKQISSHIYLFVGNSKTNRIRDSEGFQIISFQSYTASKNRRGRRGLRRRSFRSRKVCQSIQNKIRGVEISFSPRKSLLVRPQDNLQDLDRVIIHAQSNFENILRTNQKTFTWWKRNLYAPDFILYRMAYIRRP